MIKSVNVVYLIDKNNSEGLNNIDKDQLKNVTNNYILINHFLINLYI